MPSMDSTCKYGTHQNATVYYTHSLVQSANHDKGGAVLLYFARLHAPHCAASPLCFPVSWQICDLLWCAWSGQASLWYIDERA